MVIHVIGLGETAKEFKPDGNITIGVNDVKDCDYQVCVDRVGAFTSERLTTIKSLAPMGFFSQLEDWSNHPAYRYIQLKNVSAFNNRWKEYVPSSNNSPFVACGVAFKYLGAKEIRLWGVDFNTHKNLNGKMRDASVEDYKLLNKLLSTKGCKIVPHAGSYLSGRI